MLKFGDFFDILIYYEARCEISQIKNAHISFENLNIE